MIRNKLIEHIQLWIQKLGNASAVAKKCGISDAALSTVIANKYGANEAQILGRIAGALDYNENALKIVSTTGDYRRIAVAVEDAREESMWFMISEKAGSGKTATLKDLFMRDTTGSIYYLECDEWNARQFAVQLAQYIVDPYVLRGAYKSIAELVSLIADKLNGRMFQNPVLFIDQANSLKPAAKRLLLSLYNKTEDRLGLLMAGTEALKQEMEAGVKYNRKGYDELYSRFGRRVITLRGWTKREVYAVCEANGFAHCADMFWTEVPTTAKPTLVRLKNGKEEERMVEYLEDYRRVKHIIKRERRKQIGA